MEGFRLNCKGFFLTYAQCPLDKEEVLEHLKTKRKGLKEAVVCRELHEDGQPHLHAYLYYETPFDCRNARFFDIEGYHPSIESAKSLKAVKAYIKKDGDIVEFGINYRDALTSIKEHKRVLGKRFLEGENPATIISENPELFFEIPKIEQALEAWKRLKTPYKAPCVGFVPNSWGLILPVLETKHRHYWFWSTNPNKGKTTWLQMIKDKYPAMWYSWTEKFQTAVLEAQFVLLDEYSTGHLTVTQLNMMCDGTYAYPVKGSASFALPKSIVLVCGNKNPLEIYKEEHHELIKARFIINCLDV